MVFFGLLMQRTAEWFLTNIKTIWLLSRTRERIIFFAFLAVSNILCFTYVATPLYRRIFGLINYYSEFIRAVLGQEGIESAGACGRIKVEDYPWLTLIDEDWFKLQRCLGNEDGFIRQGDLTLVIWDAGKVVFAPFKWAFGIGVSGYLALIVFHLPPNGEAVADLFAGRDPNVYGHNGLVGPRTEQDDHDYYAHLATGNRLRWFGGQRLYVIFLIASIVALTFTSIGLASLSISACVVVVAMALTYDSAEKWDGIEGIIPNALRILKQVAVETWNVVKSVFGAIGAIYASFALFWNWIGRLFDSWSLGKCQHIQGAACHCFDNYVPSTRIQEEHNGLLSITADNEACHQRIEQLEARITEVEEERDDLQYHIQGLNYDAERNGRARGWPAPPAGRLRHQTTQHGPSSPSPEETLGGEDEEAITRRVRFQVEDEYLVGLSHEQSLAATSQHLYDELLKAAEASEVRLKAIITGLESQLGYTHAAGPEKTELLETLEKARIRHEEQRKQILEMINENNGLKSQLSWEQDGNYLMCHNDAICSQDIRRLTEERDKLLAVMEQNELWVQEAVVQTGHETEPGQTVSLREYLMQSVHYVLRAQARGSWGHIRTDDDRDRYIQNLELDNDVIYATISRLEREIERLGGNLRDIRRGVEPPRAMPVYEVAYEVNADLRVFPIYKQLWDSISGLTQLLVADSLEAPEWEPVPLRNDITNTAFQQNPDLQNSQALEEDLTRAEIQRLYSRVLQLKLYIKVLFVGQRDSEQPGPVMDALQDADITLWDAAFEVLDNLAPLVKNRTPDTPIAQRRYPYYKLQQLCILELTNAIVTFNGVPPPWIPNPNPMNNETRRKSAETLARNLMKYEINTLNLRIQQLLTTMEIQRMPGTVNGPKIVEGSADWQAKFKRVVDVMEFAALVKTNWENDAEIDTSNPVVQAELKLPYECPLWMGTALYSGEIPISSRWNNGNNKRNYNNGRDQNGQKNRKNTNNNGNNGTNSGLEAARMFNKECKDRIMQLGRLCKQHNVRTGRHLHKDIKKNISGFPNSAPEMSRLFAERPMLLQRVRALEGFLKDAKIKLPKWPKSGGAI